MFNMQMNTIPSMTSPIQVVENKLDQNIEHQSAHDVGVTSDSAIANQADALPNHTEPAAKTEQATDESNMRRHIITYVGNGTWFDMHNVAWSRHGAKGTTAERSFTDDEYDKREDIKFMVGYGTMRHSIITV